MKEIWKAIVSLFVKQPATEPVVEQWVRSGKPLPPPHIVKQQVIAELGKESGISLLIETGTYLGDMVEAQKFNFKRIYSIELGEELFITAKNRFARDPQITILQGDSSEILSGVVKELIDPAIFWLDGHYSAGVTARGKKECPIFEELAAIFDSPYLEHIILIDDARLFVGENDYPLREDLASFIIERRPQAVVTCEDDIIRVVIHST